MRKILRVLFLVVALALLAYGILGERHLLLRIPEADLKQGGTFAYVEHELGGFAYTEGASREGYMLRDGEVYDAYSTVPVTDCAA
ncbi:MAG: hypothetical protein ACYSU0_23155 [Planctomycetota bacterium]